MEIPWAIYARQSLDRKGLALAVDRQIEDCVALGKRLKLQGEPTIYTDNDVSASSERRRPAYKKLLAALRAGQHEHLIVWHTDRLHRRPIELEEFIGIAEAQKVVTHTVKAGELDLATSSGRMVARMLGAAARQEVEHKSDRRSRAAQQKTAAGRQNGGPRWFGYGVETTRTNKDGKDETYIDNHAVRKNEATAIEAAFAAILRGESTTSIWKAWNARGLKTVGGNEWNGSVFRNMIKRPSLAGIVTYRGVEVPDAIAGWPAIVDRETWEQAQAVISNPARRTSPGPQVKHLSSGIAVCGAVVDGKPCGQPMRSGSNSIKNRNGEVRKYTVYRCTGADRAGHATILKHVLDSAVRAATIRALVKRRHNPIYENHADEVQVRELNVGLAEAKAAEERLVEAIADGLVSAQAARKKSNELKAKFDRLTAELREVTQRSAMAAMADEASKVAWDAIDINQPVHEGLSDGARRFHPGVALIRAIMRDHDLTRTEAALWLELAPRFDSMPLEQQRALVRSVIQVSVLRGSGADRIAVIDG